MKERWPPAHDEESLRREIKVLRSREFFEEHFYEWRAVRSLAPQTDLCQCDVVRLDSDIPFIHSDGQPATKEHQPPFWMVLGNSCDFERGDIRSTQLVPLRDFSVEGVSNEAREALQHYTVFKWFYVPPWDGANATAVWVADLPEPVTDDKAAFPNHIHVEARMSRAAWALLNCCLTRFLARNDGRYD